MKSIPQIKMTAQLSKKTIEYLQTEEGLTQQEIAAILGTTPAYLKQVKAGKKELQPKHLKNLSEKKPDIYMHILQVILTEKFGSGLEYLKGQSKKVQKTGKKSLKAIKGVTEEVAFAVCKLLTRD
jgi:transcriptional regulator with XRE-family HTH domain